MPRAYSTASVQQRVRLPRRRAKGYKDILDPEVEILVSYIPEDSAAITIDRIVCASFSEIPAGMKSGDLNSEHALPFVALDIDYDINAK